MLNRVLLLASLLGCTACTHWPVNEPLSKPLPQNYGYRFQNLTANIGNTDSTLVCLSFSGGGTRASAMAYGVIRTLEGTKIAGDKTLLDEVDLISAASGGSFAAAYYGAYGKLHFLRTFRNLVLRRDLGMEIFWRAALCPYNLVRICSPWFNRSDLASELYYDTVFGPWTYGHLERRGRPFVVLSATDMAQGARFEFTQDQFDGLGSPLGRLPLARAVAASAAFPVLLTPIALQDHTSDTERYVHLVDGGVIDNMGLGHVIESYQGGALRDLVDSGRVETLVFIVVDARNRPPEEISASPQAPGAASVLAFGLEAAIDRRGEDQIELLADLCQRGASDAPGNDGPVVHLIHVDLADLLHPGQRRRLLEVETTFGLEEAVTDELIEATAELLERNPKFRRLVAALR